jgi:hypothetical protein
MKRPALILTLWAALSAGVSAQDPLTDAERANIAVEVESRFDALLEYAARGENVPTGEFYAAELEGYFLGEPATFLQGVRLLSTVEEMETFFQGMDRQGTLIDILDSRVAVLSRDIALQVTQGQYTVISSDGVRGDTFPLSTTNLWVRDDDGVWRMLHGHQSWTLTPVEGS